MPLYYDDSFGFYEDMGDPDVLEFYFMNQRRAVQKKCADCDRIVLLLPKYDCCNDCANRREQGLEP